MPGTVLWGSPGHWGPQKANLKSPASSPNLLHGPCLLVLEMAPPATPKLLPRCLFASEPSRAPLPQPTPLLVSPSPNMAPHSCPGSPFTLLPHPTHQLVWTPGPKQIMNASSFRWLYGQHADSTHIIPCLDSCNGFLLGLSRSHLQLSPSPPS